MARPSATPRQPDGQQLAPQKLTVAQILIRNAGQYVATCPNQAPPQVQSTLAKLSLCRTAALGGHRYRCQGCHQKINLYNSCGDRHCPTCSGASRSDWLESTRELILDGVDHFQVVFTLPSELSRLALGNRKPIYDLLFTSAWAALKQTIQSEHGFDGAAVMVLHTWNQKLDAHAHVHAVVPGCGPATDGSGLRVAKRGEDESTVGKYLVNADALRNAYREKFLSGLDGLKQQGLLKLEGEFEKLQPKDAWLDLLNELAAVTWVSFIQPPPQPGQSAEHVLKYLARYLSGGPISDSRIVSTTKSHVTLMARQGETTGGEAKQVPITLTQLEFTRRWSLHILPKGYTRTRRFGGWTNTNRADYVERLAIQMESEGFPLPAGATDFGPFDEGDFGEGATGEGATGEGATGEGATGEGATGEGVLDKLCKADQTPQKRCPNCDSPLIPHSILTQPRWADVMSSKYRPRWY